MAKTYSLDNYKLTGSKKPNGPRVIVNWGALNARKMMFCEFCEREQPFEGHRGTNDTMMRCCSCDVCFVDTETGKTSVGTPPTRLKTIK